MSGHFYPPVDLDTIRHLPTMFKLYQEHPTYFLESPYPGEVERIFRALKKPQVAPETEAFKEAAEIVDLDSDNKWENLAKEARKIYKEMKAVKHASSENDKGLSPNEKMRYYKELSALLEKLVSLEERALGLKKVHDFHKAVMEVMESVLSPTQRTDVMEKLQATLTSGEEA